MNSETMGEYIARDPLLQIAKELQGKVFGAPLMVEAIKSAPAADVVVVRHARWIERIEKPEWLEDDVEIYYECSNCGCNNWGESPYCPNCGAKMDKEIKEYE